MNDLKTAGSCSQFYQTSLGFQKSLGDILCSGGTLEIKTFDFSDVRATSKAWMNIALNNHTYDASDYADLVFLSSMSSDDLNTLIFASTSKFQTYMTTNVFTPIFNDHSKVCTIGKAYSLCSPKELAYQQWLDLSILPSTDPQTPKSYVELYP